MNPELVERDPTILAEKRLAERRRLAEKNPELSGDQWRILAREQLAFWCQEAGIASNLPPKLPRRARDHQIDIPTLYAAFFAYEPEEQNRYLEIPFFLALLSGDKDLLKDMGDQMGFDNLSPSLFEGPFPPFGPNGDLS